MHLVDTQFIFGLRKSDKHHQKCVNILKNHSEKLCFSFISILEVTIVMMTKNKTKQDTMDFISTVKDLFRLYKIPEIEFQSQAIERSLSLRIENPNLSFFDSILLAVTEQNSLVLLGDDPIFPKFNTIPSNSLSEFIEKYSR